MVSNGGGTRRKREWRTSVAVAAAKALLHPRLQVLMRHIALLAVRFWPLERAARRLTPRRGKIRDSRQDKKKVDFCKTYFLNAGSSLIHLLEP